MDGRELHTTCCIVGGGPAGMMTGFLLARAGIDVIVLEKHKDFFRDFRGDTIHPSTFQLMHELGLLEDFLRVPHQEVSSLSAIFNGHMVHLADFSHLKVARPVIGLMPQWDFLNFIVGQAARYDSFSLIRQADVTECGYVIDKDGYDKMKEEGLNKFRTDLAETSPFLKDRLLELTDWTDIQLLNVKIDHLHTWYREGLRCTVDRPRQTANPPDLSDPRHPGPAGAYPARRQPPQKNFGKDRSAAAHALG
jgi:hypothetical protein